MSPISREEFETGRIDPLRAALRLLKRMKLHTPADGCVICRHKDREHLGDCLACRDTGSYCVAFMSVKEADEVILAALGMESVAWRVTCNNGATPGHCGRPFNEQTEAILFAEALDTDSIAQCGPHRVEPLI